MIRYYPPPSISTAKHSENSDAGSHGEPRTTVSSDGQKEGEMKKALRRSCPKLIDAVLKLSSPTTDMD